MGFRLQSTKSNPLEDPAAGVSDQLMLGMDAAQRGHWRSYDGAPGVVSRCGILCAIHRALG
jgi:hypothetical protein